VTYKKRPRAGTVHPAEQQAQGNLINMYKYLMGRSKENGVRLLSMISSERTRGYGNK